MRHYSILAALTIALWASILNGQTDAIMEEMNQAIEHDDAVAAAMLIQAGFDLKTPLDSFSNTALHLAVKWKRPQVFELLLAQQPDLEYGNQYQFTPLGVAAIYCNAEAAVRLLDLGAAVEPVFADGTTPLEVACQAGCLSIVQLLAARGASVRRHSPSNGLGPIHRAAFSNAPEIIEFLLGKGAEPTASSTDGFTPLHALLFGFDQKSAEVYQTVTEELRRHVQIDSLRYRFDRSLRLLLASGAELEASDAAGKNLHDYALEAESEAFAEYIKKTSSALWRTEQPELKVIVPVRHSAGVNAVCFSADGHYVASAASDGKIKIWNIYSGREVRTLERLDDNSPVTSVQFSPDGRFLLASYSSIMHNLVLWDWQAADEACRFIGHGAPVTAAVFAPDGQRVFSASWDCTIKTWDVKTAKLLDTWIGHESAVHALALSADGRRLASGGEDHLVVIWDMEQGLPAMKLKGHSQLVTALAFSPSGQQLASGAFDHFVKLWDTSSGRLSREIRLESAVNALHYHEAERLLLVGTIDKIGLYDVETSEPKQEIRHHQFSVNTVCFAPGCHSFASGANDKNTLLWSASGTLLRDFSNQAELLRVFTIGDDLYQAVANFSPTPVFGKWDLETGRLSKRFGPLSTNAEAVCSDQASGLSAAALAHIGIDTTTDAIQVYSDIMLYNSTGEYITQIREANAPVFAICLSPGGQYLAASVSAAPIQYPELDPQALMKSSEQSFRNSKVKIWRLNGQKLIQELHFPGEQINSLSFSPSGEQLVLGAAGRLVAVFAQHGDFWSEEARLQGCGPAIFIDNLHVLHATSEGRLIKDNWRESDPMPFSAGHDRIITTLCLSPDGKYAASGAADYGVKIWETATGRLVQSLIGHEANILSAAFVQNGRLLVSSAMDYTTRLWDAQSGKLLLTLLSLPNGEWMSLAPDGYYAASKGAAALVSFSKDNRTFDFEQFDLWLNRPDIMMERLGHAGTPLHQAFMKAHERRSAQLKSNVLPVAGFHSPELQIDFQRLPLSTVNPQITFLVQGRSSVGGPLRILADINGVPALGRQGLEMKPQHDGLYQQELQIALGQGANKIQAWVTDEKGQASEMSIFNITREGRQVKPKLYFLGLGVSRFANPQLNLQYAAKDIEDAAQLFQSQAELFEEVHILNFLNEEVSLEGLRQARQWLSTATVDDAVIIYAASHGFFDSEWNYFLAGHEADLQNPERGSIPYQELERLLETTHARQRLVLIDACHAGEADMDSFAGLKNKSTLDGEVIFRGLNIAPSMPQLGFDNTLEFMKEIFNDLRRGTGATVVAATRAGDFAIEGTEWQNGVFTYCLLKGLREGTADLDRDGQVTVSELLKYLSKEVPLLTDGRQQPTFRTENIANNWRVW